MRPGALAIMTVTASVLLRSVVGYAAQPAQPVAPPAQPPAAEPVPPPTEAELRERALHWIHKLKLAGDPVETDRVRKNLIALGKPGVPLIIEAAQKEFGEKPLPFYLWNVCLTLGRMADDRAVPYLMKRLEPVTELELKQRPDWNFVRAFAALSLGKISDPAHTAMPALRKIVRDENENVFTRRTSALALGSLQDDGCLDTMSKILQDPKAQPTMRGGMAMALGMVRGEAATDKLIAYISLDAKERDAFADRMAVQALGMQKAEKAVDALRKMLAATEDNSLKGSVVLVLGWIGKRDAAADVQKVMDDEQVPAFTRCNAAVALGGLGKPDAGSAFLRKTLQSEPNKIVLGTEAYAAVALGEFFGDDNIKALCDSISSTKFSVVALNGINALGHRKDPRTAPFLIEHYHKFEGARNQYLRGEIVRALMAFPTQEAIRGLCIKGLKDNADYVQAKCAVALARYPGADTDAALIEALSDRAPDVRGEAALTLGLLKSLRSAEPLRKLLQDESDWVRLRARRALENILKYGKNEFQQTAGIQDLIDQRVKAVGASLSEEMNRLYTEGYQKVLELDKQL